MYVLLRVCLVLMWWVSLVVWVWCCCGIIRLCVLMLIVVVDVWGSLVVVVC